MANDIGPGSVVVCVDASGLEIYKERIFKGSRYRIRSIRRDGCCRCPGRTACDSFILYGFYERNVFGAEYTYCPRRFRPIDDGDAAIFRAMIAPIKQRVRVQS